MSLVVFLCLSFNILQRSTLLFPLTVLVLGLSKYLTLWTVLNTCVSVFPSVCVIFESAIAFLTYSNLEFWMLFWIAMNWIEIFRILKWNFKCLCEHQSICEQEHPLNYFKSYGNRIELFNSFSVIYWFAAVEHYNHNKLSNYHWTF